ncbi:uncharacterized protein LOC103183123 [Callorhinchus milii]|uniref:Uncharacterized LOC103183123 n=1 Tax=Callorhinchus milii TaxID=7868 RepID=A0A4W3H1K7_CALMI|nr:uncharacterized protein LOC103183123 [Callorhinchus milii]XP_007898589.1 uncharacterized protein LOC103183123 [Callorhinchus milii]XP_042188945.1 uncharacterized protein LOC103183123 [Callorhinchus milii]|eukprot:gi/632964829/ref/XP_007898588.1/ PREDICTED: uncharacterized protein LOC103183123 [Callorhinchus milii]
MAVATEVMYEPTIEFKESKEDKSLISDFIKLQPGRQYLQHIVTNVVKHRGKVIRNNKSSIQLELTIGQLEDTVYFGRDDMLESWQEFYLPERMDMIVLGTIDNLPCLAQALQLVVLVGQDGSVFAYEEEVLHKIAKNVQELFEKGPTFPGIEVYEYGSGYRPKTNEEYMAALKKAGLDVISEETKAFVKGNANEIMKLFT